MPDWHKDVSCKLENSQFGAAERDEISRELAGYLEDLCADAPARGLDGSAAAQIDATQTASAELHEDQHLGAHLYRARKENPMYLSDRTKRLWLPGMAMFVATAALLAVFQSLALGLYHVVAPLPITGTLSAHVTTYPELVRNVMRHDSAALMTFLGWLCTLPFLGALGAYCSRRMDGQRWAQIATGLFPLLLFLAIFIDQWTGIERNTFVPFLGMDSLPPAHIFFTFLSGSVNLLLNWVLIPGAALLSGVLPFVLSDSHAARDLAIEG